MALSVFNPINPAMNRTGKVLFKPFNLGKWFVLGFCAFLAQCGEASFRFQGFPSGGGGGGGGPSGPEVLDWLTNNITLVASLVAFVTMISIGLFALVYWLNSRGQFMLLDGVVHDRALVTQPWREFQKLGNSLLGFRLVLMILGWAVMLVIAGSGLTIAWPDIHDQRFTLHAGLALLVGIPLMLTLTIAYTIIIVLLIDFVVPAMYLNRVPVMEAWRLVWAEVITGHVGTLVLYLLMKVLIAVVVSIISTMAMCLTCCLAALPYLGSVILLPLAVFSRCYSLYFLEQLGPAWRFFEKGLLCPRCQYDLRGSIGRPTCPECGCELIWPDQPPEPAAPTG